MKLSGEPDGIAVKQHITENFKLNETVYPPKLKQPRHTHSLASFSFVLSGNYLENFRRRDFSRQPSTVIFHPPHESHSVDYGNKTVRILSVQIGFEKLAYIREQSIGFDSSTSCRTDATTWLGNRIYQEFRRADGVSALAIEGLVLEILAEASRIHSTAANEKIIPNWLKEAKDFLHDNFAESFVLEDVAKISGVHPVHLSRAFRRKFDCTIGEYIRRLRGEFALRQIRATDATLGEIAHAAGFSDQSHFNKTFKTLYGLTPSEYRRISRQS
ncbi:MAG: AraC family transcriptional regulator [Acidobacteriota bacterium]|nr:AraC family transcriptional regulator [Acidobacteriota bacterium]